MNIVVDYMGRDTNETRIFKQLKKFKEEWPGELTSFSWVDFLTAITSPIFLIITYKDNGKPKACLQSWSTFVSSAGEFICIIGSVSKSGHLHKSLMKKKECVLNFPSYDVYDRWRGNNSK